MSTQLLIQSALNGFGLAVDYILVALGLTLIFSILGIINFAHGEFYMLGGFATYYAFGVLGLPYGLALLLAVLAVGGAGVLAERLVFRRLRGKTLNGFIVSLGLLWVLQASAQLGFGVLDKAVPSAVSGVNSAASSRVSPPISPAITPTHRVIIPRLAFPITTSHCPTG